MKVKPTSWIDSRLEIRNSPIQGKGMFTRLSIKKGEILVILGGMLITEEECKAGKVNQEQLDMNAVAIDESLYLLEVPEEQSPINHSCEPNVWMEDEITISARRDIKAEEELTADYGMWDFDESCVIIPNCDCGSKLCRKVITGRDWRIKELQERYQNHFPPFLNERIRLLKNQ